MVQVVNFGESMQAKIIKQAAGLLAIGMQERLHLACS